ncbi:MAG: hypothetical protein ACQEVA_10905 [Myxococcota bacterium]
MTYRIAHFTSEYGALLLLTVLLSACASAPAEPSEPTQREIPPEVTDRTTQPYLEDEPPNRPTLDVVVERVSGAIFPVDGAAALVEREGLRCYRLGRNQQEDLEGTIIYEVMVTTNGRVAGADLMSASFRNDRVESCLERILHRLRFDVAGRDAPLFSRLYVRIDMLREMLEVPDEPDLGGSSIGGSG